MSRNFNFPQVVCAMTLQYHIDKYVQFLVQRPLGNSSMTVSVRDQWHGKTSKK